ncbi:MAG: hypothetical protein CM15mP68_0460 [Pseudomonadota bacterium]|nr:MAG: hypothetical protein CM15mP68_0460 [Pseudomonadota bacterium]
MLEFSFLTNRLRIKDVLSQVRFRQDVRVGAQMQMDQLFAAKRWRLVG